MGRAPLGRDGVLMKLKADVQYHATREGHVVVCPCGHYSHWHSEELAEIQAAAHDRTHETKGGFVVPGNAEWGC